MAPAGLSTDPGPVTEDEDGSRVSRIRPGRPMYVRWRQRLRPGGVHQVHWGRSCLQEMCEPLSQTPDQGRSHRSGLGSCSSSLRKGCAA